MTEIAIRKVRPDDIEALTDLCMRSKQSNGYDADFLAQCAEELRVRESWVTDDDFWLAEAGDGQITGCIRLSRDGTAGELETCFIDPDWQGRRIGRRLFEALLQQARRYQLHHIGLDADPFAEPFYARLGFATVGSAPSGSIPGRMLPRMEMTLRREDGAEQEKT